MTVTRPFRAVRYDPARVELGRVIVPPYDVIAADERGRFFDRDPHNAIRLELTRDVADEAGTDYAEVAETFEAWREAGVLVQDDTPAFYVMRQTFAAPTGETLTRIGFFAELGLADYDERVVRPHERTLAGPKADRLKILRAARANLSSVFLLYEDREDRLAEALEGAFATGFIADAKDEAKDGGRDGAGVHYALARIDDPEVCARIEAFMAERPTVIADGHHRYETALAYRDEQRAEHGGDAGDAESTLAFFANAWAPGSLLLPIHRVVVEEAPPGTLEAWLEALPGWQGKTVPLAGPAAAADVLEAHLSPLAGRPAFAADDGSGVLHVLWRDDPLGETLMVRVLESDVIGRVFGLSTEAIRDGSVSFPKSAARAAREVREGRGTVALYLNPLGPDDVFRATERGEVMPQKSTYFHPKIPTGMVFRAHAPVHDSVHAPARDPRRSRA